MKISVPYYSQHRDIIDPYWKSRACGVTCLKMVLDFHAKIFNTTIPTLDELIKEGIAIKAFSQHGWIHQGIVFIAHNHGVPAYQEEFRSLDGMCAKRIVNFGFKKILKTLDEGKPVIVSVEQNFEESDKFHQVVLVGREGDLFLYHEPEAEDKNGAYREVSTEQF